MNKKLLSVIIIPIIALTICSALLRFYKVSERQYWMVDEERDAFIVKKIIKDKRPTLIGGALPGGFYLAPGYFYISALFYFFSNLNPLGLGYAAAFFGTISTPLIFFVTKKLFGNRQAFLATVFYTFSYLSVIYNRTWWPLTFSPIITLVSYFLIYQIIKTRNLKLTIALSAVMVIAVQTDPSNFSTLLLVPILWLIFKLPWKSKYTAVAILIFLLSHISLVVFDLRHDFLNTKAILKFFSGGTGAGIQFDFKVLAETFLLLPRSFIRFFWVFGNKEIALQIAPSEIYIAAKNAAIPISILIASIVILISYFVGLVRDRKNQAMLIVGLHVIIALVGISFQNLFFGNWNFEWLMQVLFPTYAILAAITIDKTLSSRWLKIPIWLSVFAFVVFSTKVILTSPNSYNLLDKIRAVQFAIDKVDNRQFLLDSIGENFSWGGYRYLFYLYGHEPARSYMDSVFAGWLYPKREKMDNQPEIAVVIVNPDFYFDEQFDLEYQTYRAQTIERKKFGAVEVLVVNNKDQWIRF